MSFPKIRRSPKTAIADLYRVIGFTIAYMVFASGYALWIHNWEFLLYISVIISLAGLIFAIRLYAFISVGVFWGLAVWGLMHMAGGLMHLPLGWPIEGGGKQVLYSLWVIPPRVLKYDNIVHAYGFYLTTVVLWQALRGALENIRPRFSVLTLCVLGALGLGSLTEVVEYAAVVTLPSTNVGGYANTMMDLIFNTLGAVAAAIVLAIRNSGLPPEYAGPEPEFTAS